MHRKQKIQDAILRDSSAMIDTWRDQERSGDIVTPRSLTASFGDKVKPSEVVYSEYSMVKGSC